MNETTTQQQLEQMLQLIQQNANGYGQQPGTQLPGMMPGQMPLQQLPQQQQGFVKGALIGLEGGGYLMVDAPANPMMLEQVKMMLAAQGWPIRQPYQPRNYGGGGGYGGNGGYGRGGNYGRGRW